MLDVRTGSAIACGVAAWGWLLILVVAPLEAAGTTLSAAVYALGSFICHQQPDRSFHLGVAQVPVCARCFGLYGGAALGTLLGGVRLKPSRYMVVAALPTIVTWAIEVLGIAHPSNVVRAVAALPLGMGVAVLVGAAASGRLR